MAAKESDRDFNFMITVVIFIVFMVIFLYSQGKIVGFEPAQYGYGNTSCGDGTIQTPNSLGQNEQCEPPNSREPSINGKSCSDYGFTKGELECTASCTINPLCYNETTPPTGGGGGGGESCDKKSDSACKQPGKDSSSAGWTGPRCQPDETGKYYCDSDCKLTNDCKKKPAPCIYICKMSSLAESRIRPLGAANILWIKPSASASQYSKPLRSTSDIESYCNSKGEECKAEKFWWEDNTEHTSDTEGPLCERYSPNCPTTNPPPGQGGETKNCTCDAATVDKLIQKLRDSYGIFSSIFDAMFEKAGGRAAIIEQCNKNCGSFDSKGACLGPTVGTQASSPAPKPVQQPGESNDSYQNRLDAWKKSEEMRLRILNNLLKNDPAFGDAKICSWSGP